MALTSKREKTPQTGGFRCPGPLLGCQPPRRVDGPISLFRVAKCTRCSRTKELGDDLTFRDRAALRVLAKRPFLPGHIGTRTIPAE